MVACSTSYVFIMRLNQEYLLEMLSREPACTEISKRSARQTRARLYFIVSPENLSVFAQLRVAVPVDEARASVVAQCVHDQTSLGEIGFALRNLPLGKDDLEVFAYLLKKLALQVCDVATQRGDLVYRPVALEVRDQLYYCLQQLGTLPVLPRLAQASQLLVGSRQHLQPLQCRHGQRQVLLGAVQALDVCRHLGDGLFCLHCPFAHTLNGHEEICQLRLGRLYALHAVGIRRGLRGDNMGDILVQVILVAAERLGGGGDGRECRGVVEDGIEVLDGIVVSCIERQCSVHAHVWSLTGAVCVPESSSEEEGAGMSNGGMHQPAFARGMRPASSQM
jgi:hypothetical protein